MDNNLPAGEGNFTFYDPLEDPLKDFPLGKQTIICQSVSDWRHSQERDPGTNQKTGVDKPSYVCDVTFGVKGTEDSEGNRRTFKAYLTAGSTFINKRSQLLQSSDFLLRQILIASGVLQVPTFPSPIKDPSGYADAVKTFVTESVLPGFIGGAFEARLTKHVDTDFGPSVRISGMTPGKEVIEARKAVFAKMATK